MNEAKPNPRIKVFINMGDVEAVWADTDAVDVEIINVENASCLRAFDREYGKAEAEGFSEIEAKTTNIRDAWDEEDDGYEEPPELLPDIEMGFDPYLGCYTDDC